MLLVISGPSGVGKTTLVSALESQGLAFERIVTATTRPPRAGEVDRLDYHFLNASEFRAAERAGAFLECARVHGNSYGTPAAPITEALAQGKNVALVLDPAGASAARAAFPGQCLTVFLDAPDAELARRLAARGTEDAASMRRRLDDAAAFRTHAADYDLYLESGTREEDLARVTRALTNSNGIKENAMDFDRYWTYQAESYRDDLEAVAEGRAFLDEDESLITATSAELPDDVEPFTMGDYAAERFFDVEVIVDADDHDWMLGARVNIAPHTWIDTHERAIECRNYGDVAQAALSKSAAQAVEDTVADLYGFHH